MQSDVCESGNYVSFTLNGRVQKVSSAPGDTSLNTYIREYAKLKGTKFMCQEGGCGSCVVSLQFKHPVTGEQHNVSVNSCMFPLYACHGNTVTTTEGIGSRKNGYNVIQSRLAHFYGSQCGYCTPGWVMSMYSLLQSNPNLTMNEIENSLSGNLCRCTGYRPILDAFKSFASDKTKYLEQKVTDIEDLLKVCKKSGKPCHGVCQQEKSKRAPHDCVEKNSHEDCDFEFVEVALAAPSLKLELQGGSQWYRVDSVDDIFEIFLMLTGSYMLVGGNTAQGIIKGKPPPDVFIDINGVAFLKDHRFSSNYLYVGANTTLSDAIVLFRAVALQKPGVFSYLEELAKHIEKVANPPVRNVGTLAGNLQIKHEKRDFPSDIFLIFETVGARLSIRGDNEAIDIVPLTEFLEMDMYKKVILQIIFPPLYSNTYIVKTYKIAPRAQNAIAYVNGGFRFKVDKKDQFRVLEYPTVVFGGVHPDFIHACQTEKLLNGSRLLDARLLLSAIRTLSQEVKPDYNLPDASPQYRSGLTQALLYRVLLSLDPSKTSIKKRSGGEDITRPLSSGKQEFETDSSQPPLYQPFPKIDSLLQCSGEAQYVYDIPTVGNDDLYAALVITKSGPAELVSVDPSKALKIPGVIKFFSARDIPGQNTFISITGVTPQTEELFVTKNILYAGQCVGIIVALTQKLANDAAKHVKIVYKNQRKPVLDVREVIRNKETSRIYFREEREATAPKRDVKHVIKGEFKMGDQYHFTMENMSCLTVPTEDGIDVYCTSQWLQFLQEVLTMVLNIPENRINLKLSRLGGSYGQKISRCGLSCAACSLAAVLLQKPVRINLELETVMEGVGKRTPTLFKYETGVNDQGEMQYLKSDYYIDVGAAFNDTTVPLAIDAYANVYDTSRISIKLFEVTTDKTSTVWMRAPGTLGAITLTEQVMEHIAHELNKDPLDVRIRNLDKSYPIDNMISQLKKKADYETRKNGVNKFNSENIWKKRGISVMPIRFPIKSDSAPVLNFHAMISVYRNDGTVALVHGGVEMGQGVNTKAAQVCASLLKIPLNYVSVKPTNNLCCPNDQASAGSLTSDGVCFAVEQCCNELNKRLKPYRNKPGSPTWEQIIQAAYTDQVDLNVTYMFQSVTKPLDYNVFGVIVLEIEIDILTGEHKVLRADLLEDAGKSLNPFVDIGQVEGAFVMGLGYWTSEEIIHDPNTGRVLTNRTLNYKIPGAKDIPVDFRVYILKNSENPLGVLRSKAVGEPPLCLSISVMFAIRQALRSARKDFGLPDTWLPMDAPFTAENIFLSSGISSNRYTF